VNGRRGGGVECHGGGGMVLGLGRGSVLYLGSIGINGEDGLKGIRWGVELWLAMQGRGAGREDRRVEFFLVDVVGPEGRG